MIVVGMKICFSFVLYHFKGVVGGSPFNFPRSQNVATGVVSGMSALDQLVQHEIIASARILSRPKQFWEHGWYGQIFGQAAHGNQTVEALTKRPRLEKLEPEGHNEYVPTATASKPIDYVKQRLVLARLIQTDDEVRHGALRKFREIVLQDLSSTGLGRSLRDRTNRLAGESVLQSTFENVFSSKSTGTLAKRSGHLWQLQMWCHESNILSIFHLQEGQLYEFLMGLQSSGRGATVGKQMVQAINFIFHMTDADKNQLAVLMSTRVKGIADSMMANMPQLKQAIPLTTDIVYGLERLMYRLQENHQLVICGHLLFCIYSCARFGDTVYLDQLEINNSGDFWLIEAFSKKYKMGVSEKKNRFLPLVALGRGLFTGGKWGCKWFEARMRANLPSSSAMPAWSESKQCWLTRPMSTGEAVTFLREFITMCGYADSAHLYTCHSAKATLLSWTAKSNMMDFESRRLLGHHMASGAASVLTYARDEMVRLQHTVYKVICLIAEGQFDPDLSRVARLRQMVGNDDFPEELLPAGADEEYLESDLEESDLDENEVQQVQQCEYIEFGPDESQQSQSLLMHSVSSVVHVVASDDRLLCGRAIGTRYCKLPVGAQINSLPFCHQCENSRSSRLEVHEPTPLQGEGEESEPYEPSSHAASTAGMGTPEIAPWDLESVCDGTSELLDGPATDSSGWNLV